MADLKTSIIIRAVDKLTAPVKKITAMTDRLTESTRRAGRPARVLTDRQRDLRSQVARATASLVAQTKRLQGWGGAAKTALGRVGKMLKWTSATFGGLGYTLKRAFVDPAAEFERFETILKTIEGSSEKARASMNWIDDFAVKTPFELAQVTDAFVKLRAYGMDPTQGLLRDLGDASAAMGKPLMQAVEAIADAVTGENERLKEFGVKARAVEGGKFRYEYTVDGETRFAEALADDRAGIERTLREIFAARGFTGAMDEQSKIWDGMFSNLMDQLTRFSRMVMGSGVFDHLKGRLRALLDTFDRMAADGSLQRLADRVGRVLVSAFQWAEQTIKGLWPWVLKIADAFSWAAGKLGGWENLALTLGGLYIARPFISLTGVLKGVWIWSGKALGGLRKMTGAAGAAKAAPAGARALSGVTGGLFSAAPGIAAPGTGMLAGLMSKLAGFGGVVKGIAAAAGLLAIKFLAIGAVVAVVAGLVYKYWEPIKAFLSGVWTGFIEGLQPVFAALAPFFAQIGEWIAPVVQWFRDLFVPVEMTAQELGGFAAAGRVVGQVIGGLVANVAQFVAGLVALPFKIVGAAASLGSALIDAIVEGVTSAGPKLVDAIWGLLGKVRDLLPFSDARRGPLSRLTNAGAAILDTMGLGVLRAGPAALQRPLARTLGTAAAGLALGAGAVGAGPALSPAAAGAAPAPALAAAAPAAGPVDQSIHIQQLTINQQPGEDAGALAERVLREIEQRRQVSRRGALYDEL